MNFSDKRYSYELEKLLKINIKNNHSICDCFYQLLEAVSQDMLDNLICLIIDNKNLINYKNINKEECYSLLQNKKIDDSYKKIFLDLAYQCIDNGMPLGNGINEFGYNKSSFLSHSLLEARLCKTIASKIGLDEEKAFKLGLLHDYGRKYDQKGAHITLGFEKLFDLGYYEEAIGCLTHSFLNGNYFACYSPSEDYIVNDNLNAILVNKEIVNCDLYSFLSKYSYTDYDRILNIADLMVTDSMVVSPEKRILDMEKRRKLEGKQKEFFLSQLISSINWCLDKMKINTSKIDKTNFTDISNLIYEEVISK